MWSCEEKERIKKNNKEKTKANPSLMLAFKTYIDKSSEESFGYH